ncbi:MAG: PAS domain S-box protein [Desulfovibrionaceae bacterium]|nr:PAS domain S-box protein [Desulfovibrionaceae bacterium]MBF0513153.1 PAS domain S-box protein [Desulfovibrionaceae bacterium]
MTTPLLQAVSAGVLVLDEATGVVLDANAKALELTGLSALELIGRPCPDLPRQGDREASPPGALAQPSQGPERRLLVRPGGPDRCVPVLVGSKRVVEDGLAKLVVTVTDLSRLGRADEKYRSFFENAVEGIFQSTPSGHFIAVNPALATTLGYDSPEDLIESLTDLRSQLYVDPADRDRLFDALRRAGRVSNHEIRFYCKDGSVKWISQSAREVLAPTGELLYIEGFNVDVTDRKRAEEALRENEEKFRRTFDQSPIGVSMVGLDSTFLRVNEAFCRITGFREDELRGKTYLEITHPDDRAFNLEQTNRLLSGEIDRYEFDKRYIHKDGHVVWISLSAGLIRDGEGAPLYFLPIVQDITARKLSEETLAKTKARLDSLLTSSPAVIYSRAVGGDHAITFISENIQDLTGCEPKDFLGDPGFWLSRMHPEDAGAFAAGLDAGLRQGVYAREYRLLGRDGAYLWVRDQFRLARGPLGRPLEIVGYVTDVTDRLLIKDALQKSEARYRAIVDDQTELVCRFNPGGLLTFVNEAYARYCGKTKEELLGTRVMPMIPEADWARIKEHLSRLRPDNPVETIEHRLLMPGGEVRWQQRIDRAFFGENGELVEYQSAGRDITERINTEQKMRTIFEEKEDLRLNLEAVFRSIPDAIITVDTNMRVIQTNRALVDICCIAGEICPGQELSVNAGRCKRACFEVLRTTLRTRRPVTEYRVECLGRTPGKVIVINSSPLLDREHKFAGAVLVIRDITRLADLEKRLTGLHGHRGVIGKSKVMRDIYDILDNLSEVDSTVLITGESGTGKELIADALHYGGPRAKGPLIKVNCSALSESLLESELFGHVRGAFTGAIRERVGRFEAAEGGTIFLDEIGDISPRIQLNLLRVLENKEYERVGDSKTRRANVRVLAATNVDLREKIRRGLFREDLYYRLKVMVIHLPPLRERTEDIPLLTEHFLNSFRAAFGKNITRVSEEVMRLFMTFPWPGNVRELKYALEHACILCPGGEIGPAHLPPETTNSPAAAASEPAAAGRKGLSRENILEALSNAGDNRARAARLLGVHRRTLYRNMEKYSIE